MKTKTKKSVKTILTALAFLVCIAGWAEYLFKDVATASAPYERMANTFPIAADRATSTMSVQERIVLEAQKANFKWIPYLLRLAKCESGLREFATNSAGNSPAGSTDRGVFMINDYWNKHVPDEVAFNVEAATRWTMDKINKGGQGIWVCDRLVRENPAKYAIN